MRGLLRWEKVGLGELAKGEILGQAGGEKELHYHAWVLPVLNDWGQTLCLGTVVEVCLEVGDGFQVD